MRLQNSFKIGLIIDLCLLGTDTFNPYSAGIDFSRQILTTEVDPRTVKLKTFIMSVDP